MVTGRGLVVGVCRNGAIGVGHLFDIMESVCLQLRSVVRCQRSCILTWLCQGLSFVQERDKGLLHVHVRGD